jgi:CRISPR-associated endonuclease/helicase Cas3
MADGASCEDGSTRWVETSRGILTHSQLAPLMAQRVLKVQANIEAEKYASRELDEAFVRDLHFEFCGDLFPDWAGKWRTISVRVGTHEPPAPYLVAQKMHDYIADLKEQLRTAHEPQVLAFAEGRLLSIHPFADFNGRVTRLWLSELLLRMDLGPVELAPTEPRAIAEYLTALRAADLHDFLPLEKIWMKRLTMMR